jgi:hypothetical protein
MFVLGDARQLSAGLLSRLQDDIDRVRLAIAALLQVLVTPIVFRRSDPFCRRVDSSPARAASPGQKQRRQQGVDFSLEGSRDQERARHQHRTVALHWDGGSRRSVCTLLPDAWEGKDPKTERDARILDEQIAKGLARNTQNHRTNPASRERLTQSLSWSATILLNDAAKP